MNFQLDHTYNITRPDGSSFKFQVDRLEGRWIYGRASGGFVGAIRRSNVGLYKSDRFFKAEEVSACG